MQANNAAIEDSMQSRAELASAEVSVRHHEPTTIDGADVRAGECKAPPIGSDDAALTDLKAAATGHERRDGSGISSQFSRPRPLRGGSSTFSSDTSKQRFAAPDYERLRTLVSLYDKPTRITRRSAPRMVLRLATFTFGTLAGLAAAWWIASSGGNRAPAPSAQSASLSSFPSFKVSQQAAASAPKGISTNELPYDGRGIPSQRPAVASVPKTNPDELPYDGALSGSNGAEQEEGNPTTTSAKKAAPNYRRKSSPDAIASPQGSDKTEVQAQATQRKTMRDSQRYRAGARMKDREFDRIRQQADEELKKKPEHRRSVGRAPSRSRSASNQLIGREQLRHHSADFSRTRATLARCERAGNLIQREQCKWRVCSGMWGKKGCPSYAHAKPS